MSGIELERYSNQEVSAATGLSTGAIRAFASAEGFSTRQGWTIPEIVRLLEAPRRPRQGKMLDMDRVKMLKDGLIAYGWKPYGLAIDGQITVEELITEA